MRFGAHLPLIDFDGQSWENGRLAGYTDAARELGFEFISANDHLIFARPWLDGIVALASVVERGGNMRLATTVALSVIRGPSALAKAAAALDIISGGRFVLGVGPGSSEDDYRCARVNFDERWPRLDESIRVLRAQLKADEPPFHGRYYTTEPLEPRPTRPDGPPIWIGSFGSDAGIRRVARFGDGWLASAYHTTPTRVAEGRERLSRALSHAGRTSDGFPCSLATMWMYVTDDKRAREAHLSTLARMLNRPADVIDQQVLVGPAEKCAETLRAYADAGIDRVFVWPVGDAEPQLERFMGTVAPFV